MTRRCRRRPVVGLPVALVAGVAVLSACASGAASPAASASSSISRSATTVHPSPTGGSAAPADLAVGALFPGDTDQDHVCTATVVHSAGGDVAMTAAHCVSGTGSGLVFVPAYDKGTEPVGSFAVTGVHAPTGWKTDQSEDDDIAFLTLAPRADGASAESVAGAVDLDTTAAADGVEVTITAYNDGIDDSPVRCTTAIRDTAHQPTVDCHGFVSGSSGAAWLVDTGTRPTAVGLIGGLHQGGCEEYTSYSPSLGDDATAALAAASDGAATDTLPSPPDDGC